MPVLPLLLTALTPALASDGSSEWSDLDSAVEALSTATFQEAGPWVSGFLRFNYASSDDLIVTPPDGELGGFSMDAARLQVEGEVAGYGYMLSTDGFSGSFDLLDAYVTAPVSDVISAVMGQFRTPFLRTGLIDFDRTLFIIRTRNGVFYSVRDQGVMIRIDEGAFHAQLAAQNGIDSIADEYLLTGRVNWEIGGGFARSGKQNRKVEGAYGAPDELRAEIGFAVSDDGGIEDGDVLAFEGGLTSGQLYLAFEALAYGEGFDLDTGTGLPIPGARADTDPVSLTASFMIVPDRWELALRHEDFDDDLNRKLTSGGLNYYVQGHDLKYQLNYFHVQSDGGDVDTIALGATFSF